MQKVNDIRSAFIDYFVSQSHEVVASSPLVPLNDPTLMFVNAGMVQFKNVFTGIETRPYNCAVSSQKCVRAGGKHNDLDNVGYTARHHTFFEMLGNFSFGHYFKESAIEMSWNLITREFGLSKEKLLVTVYADDDHAFDLWKKIAGLHEDRILRIATSDNFWAMGQTGPCGPCSEIFYDHGEHIAGGPPGSPNEDGDRFIEIWNLVFMQYEQVASNERIILPKPSIDTGMGLERIAAVMQGTHDNYEIDMFNALIKASANYSETDPSGEHNISHRVISDHLRATSFLISDGVMPSNEGRGYVLRRIMRRAMRHAQMIGCRDPLIWKLVPVLISEMGDAFPELVRAETLISETLKLEETRFKETLDRGLKLLDQESSSLRKGGVLNGETAFKLYDTFGFPLDLTQDALREKGMSVDIETFNAAMERQRDEARKSWSGSGDSATDVIWFEIQQELNASEFLGYETEQSEGQITAIVVDGKRVEKVKKGDDAILVVNQTPFYAESGGQVGDAGIIIQTGGDEVSFKVLDTQKKATGVYAHIGRIIKGKLKVGTDVRLVVDNVRRQNIRANHSATHLLHASLRKQLGNHVTQKGSLVAPEKFRFDVSHPKPLEADELVDAEKNVNEQIALNNQVVTHLMEPEAAVKAGAMALFGEKYGEEVRVVSIGGENKEGFSFSTELCGGTHVKNTGDIKIFKILGESAVASGIRRIEAITGGSVYAYNIEIEKALTKAANLLDVELLKVPFSSQSLLERRKCLDNKLIDLRRQQAAGVNKTDNTFMNTNTMTFKENSGLPSNIEEALKTTAAILKVQNSEVPKRLGIILEECIRLEKEIKEINEHINNRDKNSKQFDPQDIGGVKYFSQLLDGMPAKELKSLADDLKKQFGSCIVALVSVSNEKCSIVVGITDDLTVSFNAVDLVRAGSLAVGGKGGGGRADMAQAGGPDAANAIAALEAIKNAIDKLK
jgi:alanyl-tRNA synthetase